MNWIIKQMIIAAVDESGTIVIKIRTKIILLISKAVI